VAETPVVGTGLAPPECACDVTGRARAPWSELSAAAVTGEAAGPDVLTGAGGTAGVVG